MIRINTVRELFAYNDWGREKLLALAGGIDDERLDKPFEMGEGSIRATLNHLWAAERVWLDRWLGKPKPFYRKNPVSVSLTQLAGEFRETAAERDAYLASQSDEALARSLTYTNTAGHTYTFDLGDMMLHVCNHGVHHRAQALNMLKRVGADIPKYGIDYVFHKLEQPGGGTDQATPPELDLDTIRAFYRFADWARDRVHGIAARLSDAQLDRKFEIGLGTIRRTLLHIRFAEQWWLENWTRGPGHPFPEMDETTTIAELQRLFGETADARNRFVGGLAGSDLKRFVSAQPRPNVTRTFPLGVTMLQLCQHGTHHRAQVVNMFRHVGADVPEIDYLEFIKST